MAQLSTMNPKFSIPGRFQDLLKHVPCSDRRTDAEIIQSLGVQMPVTSEKNIWAYWHSGVASMPCWTQRNVASWVRMHDSSWTVRVLDNIPDSPNHVLNFLPAPQLPECFVQGTMDGPFVKQHTSDFIRGLALLLYGGVWLDVGVILMMDLDWICWNTLTDANTPYEAAVPLIMGATIANAVLACRKNNPFISRWHDLFTTLWKGRTNSKGLLRHPLMEYQGDPGTKKAFDAAVAAAFTVDAATVREYLGQVMCWERLALQADENDDFDSAKYWQSHIMKLQASKEIWGMEECLPRGAGPEQLDLLLTGLDDSTEKHRQAEECVFRLLTGSCLQKFGHGTGLTKAKALGVLLDEDETGMKDAEVGTFGELLRYGAENFVQVRKAPAIAERVSSTANGI